MRRRLGWFLLAGAVYFTGQGLMISGYESRHVPFFSGVLIGVGVTMLFCLGLKYRREGTHAR